MAKYKVAWDYTSNLGSFDKGAVVEVDDALAEHLNRDSPGVLKPAKGEKAAADESSTEEKANAGNIEQILERVGDDPAAAAEVLEAEQAEKSPRSTLVEALEAIIAGPAEDD